VQEAVANVRRHAGATRCTIDIRATDDAVVVDIADDGRGISSSPTAGFGLASMRARAEELGGDLEILPSTQGGTLVHARIPLTS